MTAAKWVQCDEASFPKPPVFAVKISISAEAGVFTISDTEHMSFKTIDNTIFNIYKAILDNDYAIE